MNSASLTRCRAARVLASFSLAAWLAAAGTAAVAAEVTVAVAANFAAPMQRISTLFEATSGHRVRPAPGSTGRFYAQIRNAAPFDVLLAADDETPLRLEREGFGVPGTRFTYALGTLVLWGRDADLVHRDGRVLGSGRFDRLAIADPRLAPYGAAAMATLDHLGLLDALRPKLVQGENVAQAYQFVASGNAALGFVAASQVFVDGRLVQGSAWTVPAALHPPLRQDALLLIRGKDNPAAIALLDYLRGAKARAVMRSFGYTLP